MSELAEAEAIVRQDEMEGLRQRVAGLESELAMVYTSTSWRLTALLRGVSHTMHWLLRSARFSLLLTWWLATGQFGKAGRILLPLYGRYVPSGLKERIPRRLRNKVRQRLAQEEDLERIRPQLLGGGRLSLSAGKAVSGAPTVYALRSIRFRALEPLRTYQAPHHGPRVTIVTDSINSGSLYGGVATAIVFAALLARRLSADLRLVTRTEPAVTANLGMVLRTHGVPWSGNVEFLYSPPDDGGRDVPMSGEDLFLTTSWWTTRSARGAVPPNQIVYLVQEDERAFYPAGDDYLLCGETLSDPEIFYAVNSTILFGHLQSIGMVPSGTAFEPAFPSTIYYVDPTREKDRRKNFFFYARPNNLRNLFWRGLEAVAVAVEEGVLDPEQWDFYFVGKDAPELTLPRRVQPQVINNLPWPEYTALVRRIDVGLSLMYAPHASYPPFDLAASGGVVVTNRYGPKQDLSCYSPNILCVEPSVPALVAALRKAVALAENPVLRAANAARFAMPRDWATTLGPVLDRITSRRAGG